MGRRPSTAGVMVLGGLLAAAAGSWFTFTREGDRAVETGAAGPPPRSVPRMDRHGPPTEERKGPPAPANAGSGGRTGPPSTNPVAGLADPSPTVRVSSAWRLKARGPTEDALQPLARCLKDLDAEVRTAAAAALGDYADLPPEVVLDLVALVRTDPSPAVSARALWAATGRGSAELLDAAIELHRARGMVFTGEKTPPISVLDAIARSGPGGYDYLKGLLRDPDPSVRRSALQKLPTCWEASREAGDDPDRIPIVVGMLDDAVPAVRSSAAWALGRAGGGALTAKGRLLELLSDDADHECREYVDTLLSMKTGADEIGPLLVRKLASADPKVRLAGCDGLDRLGSAAAPWKEALRGCSEDGDPRVKAAATALLARLPDR